MSSVSLHVRQPRPTSLSDPYGDFTEGILRDLLATPDDGMALPHFQNLFGPFLPAGTYEETVYFLPFAFAYILSHQEDALDLVTSLAWFVSEYGDELKSDGLFDGSREKFRECFAQWTRRFTVIHFDEGACRLKGWGLKYCDCVENIEVVCEGTCDLVRFGRHADIVTEFVESLARHNGDDVRAAWFLEYARSQCDVYHPPDYPPILDILADRVVLESARAVVLAKRVNREPSPTYWRDTFAALQL